MSDDKLPQTRDGNPAETRLTTILDRKFSLQSITSGLGKAGLSPLRALQRYWRLEGSTRSRGDRWLAAWEAKRSGLVTLYNRSGEVILRGRAIDSVLEQAAKDGLHLPDADFQSTKIERANLERLKAPGADFRNAQIVKCTLDYANLRDADFSGATIKFFRGHIGGMRHADLSGADFTKARFKTAWGGRDEHLDLSGAILKGTRFRVDTPFDRIKFDRCDLSRVVLIDRRGNVVENMRLSPSGALIQVNGPADPAKTRPSGP